MLCVKCLLEPVTFNLSLTPTVTATDPPPANSPTMHSTVGWFPIIPKPPKNSKMQKISETGKEKKALLDVCRQTDRQTDIVTDISQGRFSEHAGKITIHNNLVRVNYFKQIKSFTRHILIFQTL